jgi:hypothetical protein
MLVTSFDLASGARILFVGHHVSSRVAAALLLKPRQGLPDVFGHLIWPTLATRIGPLSRKRRDDIRAEVWAKADRKEQPPVDDRVTKRLKCGHEEMVAPALNPEQAVCSQCRQKSLLSRA